MSDIEIIRAQLLVIMSRLENVITHVDTLIAEQPKPEPAPDPNRRPKIAYLGSDADQPA